MMQGYEPGKFGDTGYFRIMSGDEMVKEIKEYNGEMKPVSTGGYEDGSSSFEPVEVEIPQSDELQNIKFSFSTPKKSRLFLRNIRIEPTGEPIITGVEGIASDESNMEDVIYSITGIRVNAKNIESLPKGLYIVNGRKVVKR